MSYERSVQEIMRMLDSAAPLMKQISHAQHDYARFLPSREMLERIESLSRVAAERRDVMGYAMLRADELARNFRTFHDSMPDPQRVLETSRALDSAIRPFLDFEHLRAAQRMQGQYVGNYIQAMNSAIAEANFVAEIELSESEGDAESGGAAKKVEEQLVEEAPAGVLENLRRVDFEPITLLDRALRDPEAIRSFSSREFEDFIAQLTDGLGFEDVVITPRSGDKGRDVTATKRIYGIPILFAFECKRFEPNRPVGVQFARALLGTISHDEARANKGVLVTTSHFTRGARQFILTEPSLDSRDFEGVVGWLQDYAVKRRKQ